MLVYYKWVNRFLGGLVKECDLLNADGLTPEECEALLAAFTEGCVIAFVDGRVLSTTEEVRHVCHFCHPVRFGKTTKERLRNGPSSAVSKLLVYWRTHNIRSERVEHELEDLLNRPAA